MWVSEYLDDLDTDFRVFYRFPADSSAPGIADGYFGKLSSARFFRMAERLFAFQGVMAARAAAEKDRKKGPAPTPARSSKPARDEVKHITLHEMMLLDPTLVQYEKG